MTSVSIDYQDKMIIENDVDKTLVNTLHWSSCTVEGAPSHSLATSNLCFYTTGGSASSPKCNLALEVRTYDGSKFH